MTATASAPPLILIAAIPEHSLASVFQGRHYAVVQVHTATLAAEWVRDVRPDTIIIDAELPDMSGIDACRLLHSDPRIGHTVPTLILAPNKPTPEQRVAALRAGVWDFVLYPPDPEELLLSLETYLQAKRNIDVALAGLMDPATGLHTRPALARRARELGALMSRARGGLACVVFALDADPADPKAGSILVRSARVSDVVGALSPTEFAVLAPGTDQAGAVKLAQRIGGALRDVVAASGSSAAARGVQLGYAAGRLGAARPCVPGGRDRPPLGVPSAAPAPRSASMGGRRARPGLLTCQPLPSDAATQTIGPEGGTIQIGAYSLLIPAGALAAPTMITAVVASGPVNAVRFQPEGLQFEQTAYLTMSYANCDLLGSIAPKQIAYTTDA